jgi:hypothetical protein
MFTLPQVTSFHISDAAHRMSASNFEAFPQSLQCRSRRHPVPGNESKVIVRGTAMANIYTCRV